MPDFLCGLWRSKLKFSYLEGEHFTNYLSSLSLPSELSSQTKEKEYDNDDVDDGINALWWLVMIMMVSDGDNAWGWWLLMMVVIVDGGDGDDHVDDGWW